MFVFVWNFNGRHTLNLHLGMELPCANWNQRLEAHRRESKFWKLIESSYITFSRLRFYLGEMKVIGSKEKFDLQFTLHASLCLKKTGGNEVERTWKTDLRKTYSSQYAKHAKLYLTSSNFEAETFDISEFSAKGTLMSGSAVLFRWENFWKRYPSLCSNIV